MYEKSNRWPRHDERNRLATDQGRAVKWLLAGVLFGLVPIAIGLGAGRSLQNAVPTTSPTLIDHANEFETVDSGLRLDCRNDEECVRTSKVDWNDGQGPLPRKFLRVRLYNDGPRTVEGCGVKLAGITEITPNGLMPTDYEGPGLLIWSGDPSTKPEGKNIRSNANPEIADLFYTVHHPSGDKIYLKDQRYGSFLKFGRWYNFELVATVGDAKTVSKRLKVRFGPTWDDFEVVTD